MSALEKKKKIKFNKWVITLSLTLFSTRLCVSSASSKAERPPSLSLYPNVEGMVRGGLGGARMMPGKDIWQVSELGQPTFCSAYQVGQTAALSSSATTPAAWGVEGRLPVPLYTPTRTTHTLLNACLCHFWRNVFYSHHLEIYPKSFQMSLII